MKPQKLIAWLFVLVVPLAVWPAYVYVSRMIRRFDDVTDYTALALTVAIGAVGVLMLAPRLRLLAAALYAVAAGTTLYLGMVASLCALGDCP